MEETGLGKSGYQIFTVLPQIQAKISELKNKNTPEDFISLSGELTTLNDSTRESRLVREDDEIEEIVDDVIAMLLRLYYVICDI